MIENTDKSKIIFFANINKCDTSITRCIKNEKLDPTYIILQIIKNNKIYYKWLYVNAFENSDKIDKLLGKKSIKLP